MREDIALLVAWGTSAFFLLLAFWAQGRYERERVKRKKFQTVAEGVVEALGEAVWLLESYTALREECQKLEVEIAKAKEVLDDDGGSHM